MTIQNLHTHTIFSDGKSTAEEMVLGALRCGCTSLGFSEHSPLPWGTEGWATPAEALADYRTEILRLKGKYADQLEIFLGLEQDMDSHTAECDWDYLIGSVHSVWVDGSRRSVDFSADYTDETIRTCFGGDAYAYAEAYYRQVAEVAAVTKCQIVGHFDLVTKFNEGYRTFDETHPRYLKAALEALDALSVRDLIFEINTGAMSRGYRTAPYPAPTLLKAMKDMGCQICITSDTHHADTVLHAFDQAKQLAKACGYSESWILTKDGFVPQKI